MKEAQSTVKTIEITRAIRSAQLNGLKIKKRQAIGLLDGELLAAGTTTTDIINKIFAKLDLKRTEIATIYYGADTKSTEAEQVASDIRNRYQQMQIEVVKGGQPHYNYIISIE